MEQPFSHTSCLVPTCSTAPSHLGCQMTNHSGSGFVLLLFVFFDTFYSYALPICYSGVLHFQMYFCQNGGRFNSCASLSTSTKVVKRVPKAKSFWISFDSHAASSQNTVRKFTGWPWLFQQIFEAKILLGAYFFENSYILHQHLFHSFALSTNDSEHRPVRHL